MTPSTPASVSFFSCALVSSAFTNVLSTVMTSSYTFHAQTKSGRNKKGTREPGGLFIHGVRWKREGSSSAAAHFRFSRSKLLSPRKCRQVGLFRIVDRADDVLSSFVTYSHVNVFRRVKMALAK